MATIVLSAAGMALGGSIGGSVLGLSMATIGRAAGAAAGRWIDQRLLGSGSEAIETGRVDRFRLTEASEGAAVANVFGRMRVSGQVIWATRFKESETTTGGGKGAGPTPAAKEFSYSVSIAIAVCEGVITHVGRIWADGVEVSPADLNLRLYTGTQTQLPDPKIVAVEGSDFAPAYRGTAYLVLEDLELAQFGNRVPQFTFEVMRPSEDGAKDTTADIARKIRGVALIPGTGEYALATTPVYLSQEYGEQVVINVNSPHGGTDFEAALSSLTGELHQCKSTVLVASWFGSDLRAGECLVAPKVEQVEVDGDAMPWVVSGRLRSTAGVVPQLDDRPVYGGTPADASIVEAIQIMRSEGVDAVFYPFILMEQLADNGLIDPYSQSTNQPNLPWRGRITTSLAAGVAGSPDGTIIAEAEVAAFMGTASVGDFAIDGTSVAYSGPTEWRYRRFILHYAHLCVAAGGVSAFCIGSEMRGLTQIRGAGGSFPAVDALRTLAAEVRGIVGPDCKISYAADWSEYHGYQPVGTADKLFHLDPLWADPNIDFIGIDNYMPLSDWRDGTTHRDADAGSIYSLSYLRSNIAGGEGYDWFYHSPEARDAQIRTPIIDGDNEPWVWRYKDIEGWWAHQHHNRIDGERIAIPTDWVPQSKPIWFTELGCAAIDKGSNQPNKFLDPKSSESQIPHYSNGMRDDFMQMQYLRAIIGHFAGAANNPISIEYDGQMIDMKRAHVWAWDARPFPFFPAATSLWSDGGNYARGHWLNGRASSRTLADVVTDICARSGVTSIDVSRLYGLVRGYTIDDITSARSALQPLMVTYGFDAIERNGVLFFENRTGIPDHHVMDDALALDPERDTPITLIRAPEAEVTGRVQLGFIDAEGDYESGVAEAIQPDERAYGVARSEVPLVLTRGEGARTVSRWLQESRLATDSALFALPPSQNAIKVGDVVDLSARDHSGLYRIDRMEESGLRMAEASRVDPEVYLPQKLYEEGANLTPYVGPTPVELFFMDLPLLTGDEDPYAPYVATSARPWPGSVALYSSTTDNNYVLQDVLRSRAIIGQLKTPLLRGPTSVWDRQAGVEVKLLSGSLSSAEQAAVLSGSNTLAIGDGTPDMWEIIQFAQTDPTGTRQYEISQLLRGQAGTSGMIQEAWPAGSFVVVMNGRPTQITVPSASRGLDRHYRYGPAKQAVSSDSYKYAVHAFQGNGYRPYPVVHLRQSLVGAAHSFQWVRATRIDGDIWGATEIPLGEVSEFYQVTIRQNGGVVRQETVDAATWTYSSTNQQIDLGVGAYQMAVAQVSERYGAGPETSIVIDEHA